jgi:threonine aldolase
MPPIDLRSDTVTRPTMAMRKAMSEAPVGDDQYGEDPTTNLLQARLADLLGKDAALWFPTGTMSNQVALRTLTRPGDEVVASRESHVGWHEAGGAAANAGVQIHEIGQGGMFVAEDFLAAIKPRNFAIFPNTAVVTIENTHNRAGGIVVPQEMALTVCQLARERGIASYLDGARLWNASAASGMTVADLAAPFDAVSVAFSKGLGAPAGSLLAGSKDTIASARRHRQRMGGAMRQNGILSAAALHGLDHHLSRIVDDHSNARVLAEHLVRVDSVVLGLTTVQTNIVVFHLRPDAAMDAPTLSSKAREKGVLVNAFGPTAVRAVTHLDVDTEQCLRAGQVLADLLS